MWLIFCIRINQKQKCRVRLVYTSRLYNIHAQNYEISPCVVCTLFYGFFFYYLFVYMCMFAGPAKVFTNTELQLCRFTHLFVKHELNGYVGQHFPKSFYGYFYLAGMVKCSGGAAYQYLSHQELGLYKLIITLLSNFIRQHTHCNHICDSTNHFRLVVPHLSTRFKSLRAR